MKKLLHHQRSFLIVSILVTYLTFFIAESDYVNLKVSGILALVIMGLYFGSKLKGWIVGHLYESFHIIW